MKSKTALILASRVATNQLESGASLRVDSIRELLESSSFAVTISTFDSIRNYKKSNWDLVVVVSFSGAHVLRATRKISKNLWFDPTDSWTFSRLSRVRYFEYRQFVGFFLDMLFMLTMPKIEMLTFITNKDAQSEKFYRFRGIEPKIFPITKLSRTVVASQARRFVFVGDGYYAPNLKALDFLEKTLDYLPGEVVINVFGRNMKSSNPRLICHGYSSPEMLYFSEDIHLAPIRSGAGLKLKVAIPLWNGIPVISTNQGANGFAPNENLKIANSPTEFAQRMMSIESGPAEKSKSIAGCQIFEIDQRLLVLQWLKSL